MSKDNNNSGSTKGNFRDSKLVKFYKKEYKMLLIIPFIMLFLAMAQIGFQYATSGDFLNKDISLKGGLTMTVLTDKVVSPGAIESDILSVFPNNQVDARSISNAGEYAGYIITIDIDAEDIEGGKEFIKSVGSALNIKMDDDVYTLESIGSSLGKSFFRETFTAVIIAFILMGLVVFIYFRTLVPSLAVILSAFSDMVVTMAIVNLMGMKIGTAGIAAFLMLIGYSVDSDILLTTKCLRRKGGDHFDRMLDAMGTGMMMTMTTIAAVTVAMIFTQSEVIRQIMIILLIGLGVDIINTWIQNVGILRLYVENKRS